MRVTFNFYDGTRKELENFNRMDTIDEMRKTAAALFGIDDPAELRLLFSGKMLVDGQTFYEVQNRSVGDHAVISVLKIMKILKLDQNANETTSSPSVSPKSTSSEGAQERVEEYTNAKSDFYEIGDKVDVMCNLTGSWSEATVKRVTFQRNVKSSSADAATATATDNLLYHCHFDYCGDATEIVDLNRLAPRAWKKISLSDLAIGQMVLVNYNLDEPGKLGDWFRAKIQSKKLGRRNESFGVTLFLLGNEETPDIKWITKTDEVYMFEETNLLEKRNTEESPRNFVKRVTRECFRCHDDPKSQKQCPYCRCVVCRSAENDEKTLICDECDEAYHIYCLEPKLSEVPAQDEFWYCPACKRGDAGIVKAGEKVKLTKRQSKLPGLNGETKRKWDNGNACKGAKKKCTLVPDHFFGAIPGVEVGQSWRFRLDAAAKGVHRPPVSGIAGSTKTGGACSIVVSGGYATDEDHGDKIIYTGSGGRDLSGNRRTNKQSFDQTFDGSNSALAMNCNCKKNENGADAGNKWRDGKPVRVIRSSKGDKKYSPKVGYRYDGVYKVVSYRKEPGQDGHKVYLYTLRRDDPTPAPWTKSGKKRMASLGYFDEEVDDDESPAAKKFKLEIAKNVADTVLKDEVNKRRWEEILEKNFKNHEEFVDAVEEAFQCVGCYSLFRQPVLLPCKHLYCKNCFDRCDKEACPQCRHPLDKDFAPKIYKPLVVALDAVFPGFSKVPAK